MLNTDYILISLKLCVCICSPTLCGPMDCSLPGSSVHGILQARILEWVPFPTQGDLPNPEIKPTSMNKDFGRGEEAEEDVLSNWDNLCKDTDGEEPHE